MVPRGVLFIHIHAEYGNKRSELTTTYSSLSLAGYFLNICRQGIEFLPVEERPARSARLGPVQPGTGLLDPPITVRPAGGRVDPKSHPRGRGEEGDPLARQGRRGAAWAPHATPRHGLAI